MSVYELTDLLTVLHVLTRLPDDEIQLGMLQFAQGVKKLACSMYGNLT